MNQATNSEKEFEEVGSGFRVFDPHEENAKYTKPRAHFLKRQKYQRREYVIQKSKVSDVVLTPSILRAVDKGDLKQTEFHRLWLCGFVDRYGRGTNDLKKAILKQALAFEGEPKVGDANTLKIVDDARDCWAVMVLRKQGWAALFLAASLHRAGWFDNEGMLSDGAIAFYGKAQNAIAAQIAKKITPHQVEVLEGLRKFGKLYPSQFLSSDASKNYNWKEVQDIISWCVVNKLVGSDWFLEPLGKKVLDICSGGSDGAVKKCS